MKTGKTLCSIGFATMILGFVTVLGACGGIETGGAMTTGARWILSGIGLIGLGALALRLGLN